MNIQTLNHLVSISDQLALNDLHELKRLDVKTIICNRPDNEQEDQIDFSQVQTAAKLLRMNAIYVPFSKEDLTLNDIDQCANLIKKGQKIHLYCRSGQRCSLLWSLASMQLGHQADAILSAVDAAKYKLSAKKLNTLVEKILIDDIAQAPLKAFHRNRMRYFDVVIIGGGSAGISLCSSLLKRNSSLKTAIIEPNSNLYYQPGWTMVGSGIFNANNTKKRLENFISEKATWINNKVQKVYPEKHLVQLNNKDYIHYQQLVVAVGLELHWDAIEGLKETLGKNGVTSNYRFDLAPYTWELAQGLRDGKVIFTHPSMPVKKYAGAPPTAMYLLADYWLKQKILKDIDILFYSASDRIFDVPDYVPVLEEYLNKYAITTRFQHNLVKVDGNKQLAYFTKIAADGNETIHEQAFNILHVCPPQRAPHFIRESTLSDENGWLDVDQATLLHQKYSNVWGIGDVINTPNAKTLAAVRKQAPVVAENLINALNGKAPSVAYSGYGACPLAVERGKTVLAEFGYEGQHSPTLPSWINDGTKPTRFAWLLKKTILPWVYWNLMLKGVEWLAKPNQLKK